MFSVPKPASPSNVDDSNQSSVTAAAANFLLPNFPMTTSTFNPFMTMGLPLSSLPFPATIPQPTPTYLPPPPSYTETMRFLEIARLAVNTSQVSLVDRDEIKRDNTSQSPPINVEDDDEDQPLDLSFKFPNSESEASTSNNHRASVIKTGLSPTPRNCDIKRSASSVSHRVTPESDVSEHFRRSLSGKWPRRPTNHGHYTLPQSSYHLSTQSISNNINNGTFLSRQDLSRSNSPFTSHQITKRLSFSSVPRTCASPQIRRVASTPKRSQIIVCEDDTSQVETHFRRALGEENYEKFCVADSQKSK